MGQSCTKDKSANQVQMYGVEEPEQGSKTHGKRKHSRSLAASANASRPGTSASLQSTGTSKLAFSAAPAAPTIDINAVPETHSAAPRHILTVSV
eukprot:m.361942 g.361942  ORF g.361942 m.361942 type:complete len:94 (+) comp20006_c0_seq1:69-350(+)